MWKTRNFIGSHAEAGGELLVPSLRAPSQGDCRILKYFLAPPFVTHTAIRTSGLGALLPLVPFLSHFRYLSRPFLVNYSVHEQS